VPHREWSGEDPLHGHGLIEIAPGNGKGPQQRSRWIHQLRLGQRLPFDATRLDIDQLTHGRLS
jgi:hypothetical protein